jgi:proprotein convertase subtilisin/kexin type 2
MYRFKNKIWLTAALLLTLTACGGGGGGGDATPVAKTCAIVTSAGDPLYSDQWHLKNTGSPTGTAGEDTNVESVWNNGICGIGITIAVVDGGLEIGHEDLAANVVAGGSYNYVDKTNDPTPPAGSTDSHGTSVAGVAAAVGFNDIGVRGAAHGAELVGYNVTEALNSINEADAAVRGKATVDISNNSWSNQVDDGVLVATTATWSAAIDDGITNGRGGKGINYFWAGGNGKGANDNSNYDGMANYQGVNAVGALDDTGKSTSYSEEGANILISAHAGEFCDTNTITTVDLTGTDGANNAGKSEDGTDDDYTNDSYTQCFNGTSSATPLVAGVAALVLEANPNLTRRDLRLLLAKTARKNDGTDSDWKVNGAGLNINHKYGYGAVDAAAAVTAAPGWTLLAAEKTPESYLGVITTAAIPDGAPAVTNTLNVASSSITQLEFVDITFASDHPVWGDLILELTSPSGTKSILTNFNGGDIGKGAAFTAGFRFGSVRHFDETPVGNWVLSVRDAADQDNGNITSWSIKLYGR